MINHLLYLTECNCSFLCKLCFKNKIMFIYDLCYIHCNTILLEARLTQVVRCTRYNVYVCHLFYAGRSTPFVSLPIKLTVLHSINIIESGVKYQLSYSWCFLGVVLFLRPTIIFCSIPIIGTLHISWNLSMITAKMN